MHSSARHVRTALLIVGLAATRCGAARIPVTTDVAADTPAAPDAGADVPAPPSDVATTDADAVVHEHGRTGVHGMLLTGAGARLYLSHLPAFVEPHRVQLIVEGRFGAPPSGLPTDFSREGHSFLPEALSLDALRAGQLAGFRGAVYRGNHEQGGTLLASDVRFDVTRLVYQAELGTPNDAQQAYLVFGQLDALYAAHRIDDAPGFDQLLRVDVSPALAAAPDGVVFLRRTTEDVVANRVAGPTGFVDPGGVARTVTPRVVLSCLVGPGFASPCP
jgi:hypothetical protein